MSHNKSASAPAGKPIPVGRLVSVTIGKKKTSRPRQATVAETARSLPALSLETIATGGGIVAMIVFVVLSSWLLFLRREKPAVDDPPPINEAAISARGPSGQALVGSSLPIVLAAQPELLARIQGSEAPILLEGIGVLPREVAPEPELVSLEPREVVDRPALAVAGPSPTERAQPDLAAAALEQQPAFPTRKLLETATPVKPDQCGQFGTKVDFLPLPAQAFGMAAKEKDKLVMVLHIAGNFEDKGFT